MDIDFLKGHQGFTAWCDWMQEQTSANSSANSASEGFFRSVYWAIPYVDEWSPEHVYGTVRNPGAIIGQQRLRSKFGMSYLGLGLNMNLYPSVADITLEENGFLGQREDFFEEPLESLIQTLLGFSDWSELRLDALSEHQAIAAASVAQRHSLICHTFQDDRTYWTDLSSIREQFGGDYLKSRSANTRQQLRKAKREAEKAMGPLQLDLPENLDQALDWLAELGKLHQARWGEPTHKRGFSNPIFVQFYETVTKKYWGEGKVWIARMRAGETALAYLFNFHYQGRHCFMLGGVNYQGMEAYKPGMLAHWLAIEACLHNGVEKYDFLSGQNRYKESLSTHQARSISLVMRRPTLAFRAEELLRKLKRRVLKQNYLDPT